MTTFFVINGFNLQLTAAHPNFSLLHEGLRGRGSQVVPVDINWRHKTHAQFVEQFLTEYAQYKTDENVVIGNSFGAIAALLSAEQFKPDVIYLCSLSPFSKETLVNKDTHVYGVKKFGIRRVNDLSKYSIIEVADGINRMGSKVKFLYGEQEKKSLPWLVEYTQKYSKFFNSSEVHEVAGAPHSLRNEAYQRGLLELIS